MKNWEGRAYLDDRLFIIDLQRATKGDKTVWAVTALRNVKGLPPVRVDDFSEKEEAVAYLMKVEPSTPCISLRGESPQPKPTYDEYLLWCKSEEISSAMDMYRLKQGVRRRKLIIEEVSPEEYSK